MQKNDFVAVAVRLLQTEGETKLVYSGWAPSVRAGLLGCLLGPLVGYLLGSLLWRGLTNEVKAFTARVPEFQ